MPWFSTLRQLLVGLVLWQKNFAYDSISVPRLKADNLCLVSVTDFAYSHILTLAIR